MKTTAIWTLPGVVLLMGGCVAGRTIDLPAQIQQPVLLGSVVGTGKVGIPTGANKMSRVEAVSLEYAAESDTRSVSGYKDDAGYVVQHAMGDDLNYFIANGEFFAKSYYTCASWRTEMHFKGDAYYYKAPVATVPSTPTSSVVVPVATPAVAPAATVVVPTTEAAPTNVLPSTP